VSTVKAATVDAAQTQTTPDMAHECPARRERISSIYKVEGRQKENKNQFQTVLDSRSMRHAVAALLNDEFVYFFNAHSFCVRSAIRNSRPALLSFCDSLRWTLVLLMVLHTHSR
jgi:hypothetical protein